MAYQDLYNTADAEAFQHMSYVAAWTVAQDIAGRPIGDPPGGTTTRPIGDPLGGTTTERKDWAAKVMREALNISPRQLAFQMMRNPAVRAAGVGATDQQMDTACLEVLDDLVSIG